MICKRCSASSRITTKPQQPPKFTPFYLYEYDMQLGRILTTTLFQQVYINYNMQPECMIGTNIKSTRVKVSCDSEAKPVCISALFVADSTKWNTDITFRRSVIHSKPLPLPSNYTLLHQAHTTRRQKSLANQVISPLRLPRYSVLLSTCLGKTASRVKQDHCLGTSVVDPTAQFESYSHELLETWRVSHYCMARMYRQNINCGNILERAHFTDQNQVCCEVYWEFLLIRAENCLTESEVAQFNQNRGFHRQGWVSEKVCKKYVCKCSSWSETDWMCSYWSDVEHFGIGLFQLGTMPAPRISL